MNDNLKLIQYLSFFLGGMGLCLITIIGIYQQVNSQGSLHTIIRLMQPFAVVFLLYGGFLLGVCCFVFGLQNGVIERDIMVAESSNQRKKGNKALTAGLAYIIFGGVLMLGMMATTIKLVS